VQRPSEALVYGHFGTGEGDIYPLAGHAADMDTCGFEVDVSILRAGESMDSAVKAYVEKRHVEALAGVGAHVAIVRQARRAGDTLICTPQAIAGSGDCVPYAMYDHSIVYDPGTDELFLDLVGDALGTMPQAFSHLAGDAGAGCVYGPALRARPLMTSSHFGARRCLLLWDRRIDEELITRAISLTGRGKLVVDSRYNNDIERLAAYDRAVVSADHSNAFIMWSDVFHFGGTGTSLAIVRAGARSHALSRSCDRVPRSTATYADVAQYSAWEPSAAVNFLATNITCLPKRLSTMALADPIVSYVTMLHALVRYGVNLPSCVRAALELKRALGYVDALRNASRKGYARMSGYILLMALTTSAHSYLAAAIVGVAGWGGLVRPTLAGVPRLRQRPRAFEPAVSAIASAAYWLCGFNPDELPSIGAVRPAAELAARRERGSYLAFKSIFALFLHVAVIHDGVCYNPSVSFRQLGMDIRIETVSCTEAFLERYYVVPLSSKLSAQAITSCMPPHVQRYGVECSCITEVVRLIASATSFPGLLPSAVIIYAFCASFVPLAALSLLTVTLLAGRSHPYMRSATRSLVANIARGYGEGAEDAG
jgi:hypothetical protein